MPYVSFSLYLKSFKIYWFLLSFSWSIIFILVLFGGHLDLVHALIAVAGIECTASHINILIVAVHASADGANLIPWFREYFKLGILSTLFDVPVRNETI